MLPNMKILFVCVGNICRSPLLHHLLKHKLKNGALKNSIEVDSCGISSWNLGEDMDERMRKSAEERGISFDKHVAKVFRSEMFQKYDYIFVVTNEILDHLQKVATSEEKKKVLLATAFSQTHQGEEIPDPYFGGQSHFDEIYEMIDTVIDETIIRLKKEFL